MFGYYLWCNKHREYHYIGSWDDVFKYERMGCVFDFEDYFYPDKEVK